MVCLQTFLKLSKPQKDNLADAYIAHMQLVDALRSQCLTNTAPFQISGQLIGLAMQERDIMQSLTNNCHQVMHDRSELRHCSWVVKTEWTCYCRSSTC